jgi:hypothetical protein
MSPDETEILRTDSLDEVGISSKNLNLKVATGDDFLAPGRGEAQSQAHRWHRRPRHLRRFRLARTEHQHADRRRR